MRVQVRLLGRFDVERDGFQVPTSTFGGRLTRRLIRVLAVAGGRPTRRDALIEALWGDSLPRDPEANLNVLVNRGRTALGRDAVVTASGGYALAADVEVDAERFLRLVYAARAMLAQRRPAEAVEIARRALESWGEPLPEDLDEPWAAGFRARLMRAHDEVLETAANAALRIGDLPTARDRTDALLAADPLRENAHRLRMRVLAAAGDTASALAAYADLRSALTRELGADPSPESQDLHLRLLRGERIDPEPARLTAEGPPQLRWVGRATQLEAILTAVGSSTPWPVLVSAPAGHGKSRLLGEISARAGLPVLAAGARLPERDEDWSVTRPLVRHLLRLDPQAFEAVPHRAAVALADVVPEAADLRELPTVALDHRTRRALVVEAVACLLERAHPSRFLLLVDDLQWADPSSAALLGQLIGRLAKLRVVLAYRPEDLASRGPVARLLRRLEITGASIVRLTGLSDADLADLVADPELRGVLGTRTDRSPFSVAEVLTTLAEQQLAEPDAAGRWRAGADAVPAARALAEAGEARMVAARLRDVSQDRRDLVALLAVLGRPAPPSLVAVALDRPVDSLGEEQQGLAETGLLQRGPRGWQTAHDLIADTVTGLLDDARRTRLHLRLAAVLPDPAEIAAQLAHATDPRAADAFATAATDRLARYAAAEAGELAEAGLTQEPSPAIRRRLLGIRADARAHTGDLTGARDDLREALLDEPGGPGRAHLLSRLSMLTFGADDLPRAAELAELALVEAAASPRARADALAVAAVIDMNVGERDRSRRRSVEALRLLRRLGDSRRVAEVEDDRAMGTFLAGDIRGGVEAFARAARLLTDCGDLLRAVTPRSTRGHGLVFLARPREALEETTAAVELARSLGHVEAQAYVLWHHSEALTANDRSAEALEAARTALSIARRLGHRGWTATAHRALGVAHEHAGDLDAAEADYAASLDTATHLPLFSSWAAARLALIRLARHDLGAAGRLVQRAVAEAPPLGQYEARLARCELAAARAEPGTAGVATAALEEARAGGHEISVPRLRQILATSARG